MNNILIGCIVIGAILSFVSGLMLLIQAFRTNTLWGLAFIFVPFAGLVFVIAHWDETKKWFGLQLLSIVIIVSPIFFIIPEGQTQPLYVTLMQGYQEGKAGKSGANETLEEDKENKGDVADADAAKADLTKEEVAKMDVPPSSPVQSAQALIDQKNAELLQTHAQLQAERASLDTQNAQAVTSFNQKAAEYERLRQELVKLKQQQPAQSQPPAK